DLRALHNTVVEKSPRFFVEHFAIVDVGGNAVGIEHHGGSHHRTCPRAAPSLVHTSNHAAAQLQLGGFQLERRFEARISDPHATTIAAAGFAVKRGRAVVP